MNPEENPNNHMVNASRRGGVLFSFSHQGLLFRLHYFLDELDGADVREIAIHRRVSKLKYSRRCAEASAVQAHMKQGLPLAPGMEIGYVVKDAHKWEVNPERTASEFDAGYISMDESMK